MPSIPFTKMHGLGNDFIVVSEFAPHPPLKLSPQIARAWCDRRFGIGADQILVVGPAAQAHSQAHSKMEIWNSDGTTAEMCGNGIRAVALYLFDHAPDGLRGRSSYLIETGAGVLEVFIEEMGEGREVRVNMGPPRVLADRPEKLETPLGVFEFWEVNMGNPHAVFFVPQGESLDELELEKIGPVIEKHPRFPKRTNVEFVQVLQVGGPGRIRVRVWERGAGITLACGTGACASAVATIQANCAGSPGVPLEVILPGGKLRLSWDGKKTGPVWMTGPALEVFSGVLTS